MIRWLSALMMICALTIGGMPVVQSVAAQAGGVTINIRTVDADTGDSITSACFVLQDFSNVGCDENGDGLIRYEGVPAGDYLVDQVQPVGRVCNGRRCPDHGRLQPVRADVHDPARSCVRQQCRGDVR